MKIPYQFGLSQNKLKEYEFDQNQSDRVKKLIALKDFPLRKEICKHYIGNFIPSPIENEEEYWMCSCFPGNKRNIPVRINIWWHEVFNISTSDIENKVISKWYMDIFTDKRNLNEKLIKHLEKNIPELKFNKNYRYDTGLDSQLAAILPIKSYFKFVENENVFQSISQYNYELSCKGRKAHKGHTYEFVRLVLKGTIN